MVKKKPTLVLNEIFGPTIQGEGPMMGRQCYFIRLFGCNLACWWCDTPYTWRTSVKKAHRDEAVYNVSEEAFHYDVDMIMKCIMPPHVVITGGEPMLQWETLRDHLIPRLIGEGFTTIEIETAGTLVPEGCEIFTNFVRFNVSPKLTSSRNKRSDALRPHTLNWFAQNTLLGNVNFKFVVTDDPSVKEVVSIVEEYGIPRQHVWLMPEGINRLTITQNMRRIADEACRYGYNVSTRLHTLAWDNLRGV